MIVRTEVPVEELMLSNNIREFASRAGNIASLERGGKLSTKQACDAIAALWAELNACRELLESH